LPRERAFAGAKREVPVAHEVRDTAGDERREARDARADVEARDEHGEREDIDQRGGRPGDSRAKQASETRGGPRSWHG
jgi:hypothetical protein